MSNRNTANMRCTRYKHYVIGLNLIFLAFFSCKTHYPVYEDEIDDVYKYRMIEIGGVEQAIMIRGYDPDKPVMLYLHGGPGFPFFPYLNQNKALLNLENKYTMVYWEQRGTGKSYSRDIPCETMKINQFVNDIKEVIEYTQSITGKEKVFLWGHSWGTNIGALFAARYPELLHAYISTGQSVKPLKNEKLAFDYVYEKAKKQNDKRALRELETITHSPEEYSVEDAFLVRKWVYKYGGIVKQIDEARSYIKIQDFTTILLAEEYSFRDKIKLVMAPYYSIDMLWEDIMDFDLFEEAPVIDVPVFFLLGRHDIIVSSKLAEKYFDKLEAPSGKKLIWFDNSAHRPFFEQPGDFLRVMLKTIPEKVFLIKKCNDKKKLNNDIFY